MATVRPSAPVSLVPPKLPSLKSQIALSASAIHPSPSRLRLDKAASASLLTPFLLLLLTATGQPTLPSQAAGVADLKLEDLQGIKKGGVDKETKGKRSKTVKCSRCKKF
ncbi:uncharacterized protein LOC130818456 [Amaranthus tricolor]|uniref:uncharacterized protein LOC130818456 n=1 Tax=Amaranthus tricolor TaxID=29722 RepID=UPI0025861976|nr:uncharacterized protein LOC130818456 [Amaranthus tricolor]